MSENQNHGTVSEKRSQQWISPLVPKERLRLPGPHEVVFKALYQEGVQVAGGRAVQNLIVPHITLGLLQRNLLYTAITRGKRVVVLVGERRSLDLAIRNVDGAKRWTGLKERLRA